MDSLVENKEDFIAAADKGLPRVAEAIIGTPTQARVDVIDAVVESYRKTALEFFDEEETKKWLVDIVARLETEVASKERQASETHVQIETRIENETQVETVPLVPTVELDHAGLDTLAFRL
jgi:hypothetical protein